MERMMKVQEVLLRAMAKKSLGGKQRRSLAWFTSFDRLSKITRPLSARLAC
jgi:hypothetical protein